jgi:dolichol-phosphate mannosyltransferase
MDERTERSASARAATSPLITIVLPTFNERGNVAPMVERIDRVLAGVPWEAIFVDDDSPDGTAAAAREIGARDSRVRCIRRVHRRGRASACIEGMLAAQARYVAVMDADLQHDEAALPEMLKTLREGGADFVVGTRYSEGGSAAGLEGLRQSISRFAGRVAQVLLRVRVSDPTSGYFATTRDVVDRLAGELATDGFNTMLDILANRKVRLRVAEVPYGFRAREHGESKLGARVAIDFGALLLSRFTANLLPQRFLLFCIVGLTGIGVHLVALAALKWVGVGFVAAQSTAALISIASNFWLNNVLTYRDRTLRGLDALKGLALYALICSFGFLSNISVAEWIFSIDRTWWIAGFTGALISAVWNYAVSAALVWRE